MSRGFIGGPADTIGYAERILEVWDRLAFPGLKPEIYHWSKTFDETAQRGAEGTQFSLPDTEDPQVNPVFCCSEVAWERRCGRPRQAGATGETG
jgi:hypothetical protein